MLRYQIDQLIPYIKREFITYDLWEEGNYTPFINFWLPDEHSTDIDALREELNTFGYCLEIEEQNEAFGVSLTDYKIYPYFETKDNGAYYYNVPHWSIEQMISILNKTINNLKESYGVLSKLN